jgi:hypothetical protein
MSNDRKKPGIAFWTLVAVVIVLILYPLSLGPACWISCKAERGEEFVTALYRPILWIANATQPSRQFVFWYAGLQSEAHWGWFRYADPTVPGGATPWQWGQLPRY